MKAEFRVIHLQAKECQRFPANYLRQEQGREQTLPHSTGKNHPCRNIELQNCETVHFCYLNHPVCGTLTQQPQQSNIFPDDFMIVQNVIFIYLLFSFAFSFFYLTLLQVSPIAPFALPLLLPLPGLHLIIVGIPGLCICTYNLLLISSYLPTHSPSEICQSVPFIYASGPILFCQFILFFKY